MKFFKKRRKRRGDSWLKEETKYHIYGIVFFVLALFLFLAPFEVAGMLGGWVYAGLSKLFGTGYYLFPVLLVLLGISYFRETRPYIARTNVVGGTIFILSGLGFWEAIFQKFSEDGTRVAGGLVGWLVSLGLGKLLGFYVSIVLLAALFIISLLVIFEGRLSLKGIWNFIRRKPSPDSGQEETADEEDEYDEEEYEDEEEEYEDEDETSEEDDGLPDDEAETSASDDESRSTKKEKTGGLFGFGNKKGGSELSLKPYNPPPLKLLLQDSGKPSAGDIKANSNIIKRTLANFGINVEMDEVTIGPSVTRYALKPAEGVKLSRIKGLEDNLALALAAHPLRIEAPIPGKSLVGIEIPNSVATLVRLGTLLGLRDFTEVTAPLFLALGRDTAGAAHFANLSKMPHLLIAGSTGSGKSVSIHTLILSLLYRNGPESLRFIMIDPKRVELTLYNRIPHLLTPVITDAKKTILALKWAAKEMERRYDILEENSVRDIISYHENILEPALDDYKKKISSGKLTPEEQEEEESELPEKMPYIVIAIDELADIMSRYPREMEAAVVRLAQMSRAVGIHLVISTQRPSTEVITGLIKANIPSRVALQVPSQIDSRTIIDMPGAEKLLGAGDMLYLSGEMAKPRRLQSGFITESEVKKVVSFLAKAYQDEGLEEIDIPDGSVSGNGAGPGSLFNDNDDEEEDDLYEEAREVVIKFKKASASFLQRKLKVGYARAARLLDMLEERGVVGPGDGAKAREIYEKDLPEQDKTYEEDEYEEVEEDEEEYEEDEDDEEEYEEDGK